MNRDAGSTYKKENYARKNNKQMTEKRRRARINSCLAELKTLVLKGLQKEESDFAKLEKADILEMTVTYLKHNRHQQTSSGSTQNEAELVRYRAGFNECAKYAYSYIGGSGQIQEDTRLHLMEHLADVLYTKNDTSSNSKSSVCKQPISPTPDIKREITSPALEQSLIQPYDPCSPLTLSTCPEYGRVSPQAGETFPSAVGYEDIQSLSLKDIQAATPTVSMFQAQPEPSNSICHVSENPPRSRETTAPHSGETTQSLPPAREKMWRPW